MDVPVVWNETVPPKVVLAWISTTPDPSIVTLSSCEFVKLFKLNPPFSSLEEVFVIATPFILILLALFTLKPSPLFLIVRLLKRIIIRQALEAGTLK